MRTAAGSDRAAPTRDEKRARTREGLLDAAERLFCSQGFHATSLDAVADAAGYTKGAVYSNFASKEDLFLAVHERRAGRAASALRHALGAAPDARDELRSTLRDTVERRGRDDGWLAVFFEFWAHVLRHPELRERFRAIHRAGLQPLLEGLEQVAGDRRAALAYEPQRTLELVAAIANGLALLNLTEPDAVDADLALRIADLAIDDLTGGAPDAR